MDLFGVWRRYELNHEIDSRCPTELAGCGCPGSSSWMLGAIAVCCTLSRASRPELPFPWLGGTAGAPWPSSPFSSLRSSNGPRGWAGGSGWFPLQSCSWEGGGCCPGCREKAKPWEQALVVVVVVHTHSARSAPAQCPVQGL